METIFSLINLGGPVVAILSILSVISLAVIILKLFQFWSYRVGTQKRAQETADMWIRGEKEAARAHASAGRSFSASIMASAISMKIDDTPNETIEKRLLRQITEKQHKLQLGFRLLDTVAQISPLLGLFGTVLGMIEAFRELQSAGNAVDPSILAGGIWVALLTTAAGLAVAMPVSLVLVWLESRVEQELVTIETLTTDILMGSSSVEPSKKTISSKSSKLSAPEMANAH